MEPPPKVIVSAAAFAAGGAVLAPAAAEAAAQANGAAGGAPAIPGAAFVQAKTKTQKANERRRKNRKEGKPKYAKSLPILAPDGRQLNIDQWRDMRVCQKFNYIIRKYCFPSAYYEENHCCVIFKVAIHIQKLFRKVAANRTATFRKNLICKPNTFHSPLGRKIYNTSPRLYNIPSPPPERILCKPLTPYINPVSPDWLQLKLVDWMSKILAKEPEKFPDHSRLIVNQYMWVDQTVAPEGKKPRDLPDEQRMGYGQILSDFQEAVDLAERGFRETTQFVDNVTKAPLAPKMVQRAHDTRSCFMASMHVAVYRAGFEQNGFAWNYLKREIYKDWPEDFNGFEIEQMWQLPKNKPDKPEKIVLCLKLLKEWEDTFTAIPSVFNVNRKKHERVLNTPFGPMELEKRCPGGNQNV